MRSLLFRHPNRGAGRRREREPPRRPTSITPVASQRIWAPWRLEYVKDASQAIETQLEKGGVRLADILNGLFPG